MFDTLHSLTSFGAIALATWGLGRPLVSRLRIAGEDRFGQNAWSFALGLVVAGTLLTGLGLCGWLNADLLRVLTVAGCGWSLGLWLRPRISGKRLGIGRPHIDPDRMPDECRVKFASPPRWWQAGLYLACLCGLTGSLVSALAPATAGDALCYHLELPKQFLQAEAIIFVPWHDNATFPLLTEIWFAWGMALEGAVTAQLIHWGLGVLFAAAVVCLARDLIGREWAWTAGAIALLIPGVTNQMTAPLNDIALAAFTTFALLAWRRFLELQATDEVVECRRWIVRAGLAAGAALAIKYVAFLFIAALGMATAWRMLRRKVTFRQSAVASLAVLTIAALVSCTWYARAAWHRGNPVYPFFASLSGDDDGPATLRESKLPLGWNSADVASAPWQLTMNPEQFGGRGHQLGCLFLATLPGLLLVRRLRGLDFLLLVSLCHFFCWFALRQNLRFFLPATPPLVVASTWVIAEAARFPAMPRLFMRGAISGALGLMCLWPLYRARQHVNVALGAESRVDFLWREEPTYAAVKFAETLPENVHILSQDYRLYYFSPPVTREHILRRETGYNQGLADADVSQTLRELGYSHVLLAETISGEVHFNATLSKLIAQAEEHSRDSVEPLLDYEIATADGELRRYRLIELR